MEIVASICIDKKKKKKEKPHHFTLYDLDLSEFCTKRFLSRLLSSLVSILSTDLCHPFAGARERRDWHNPPPSSEPDRHLQRGRPAEALETVNVTQKTQPRIR